MNVGLCRWQSIYSRRFWKPPRRPKYLCPNLFERAFFVKRHTHNTAIVQTVLEGPPGVQRVLAQNLLEAPPRPTEVTPTPFGREILCKITPTTIQQLLEPGGSAARRTPTTTGPHSNTTTARHPQPHRETRYRTPPPNMSKHSNTINTRLSP